MNLSPFVYNSCGLVIFPQIIITYLLSDIVSCQVLFKAYPGLQCHSIGNGSMLHSSCSKPEVAPLKPSCQTG